MTDGITRTDLQKFIWGLTSFKADAAQTDALWVMLESWAADQALAWAQNPRPEEHLADLRALAVQLLDKREPDFGPLQDRLERIEQAVGQVKAPKSADVSGELRRLEAAIMTLAGRPEPDLSGIRLSLDALESNHGYVTAQLALLQRTAGKGGSQAEDSRLQAVEEGVSNLTESVRLMTQNQGIQRQALQEGVAGLLASRDAQPDLRPVQAQLDAIAKTLTSLQFSQDARLSALTDDLVTVCEDIELLRRKTDERPDAYLVPLRKIDAAQLSDFVSQELLANLEEEEVILLDEPAAAVILDERTITERAVEQAVEVIQLIRDQREKKQAQDRPGCFLNGDGTITCRICGLPKEPGLFYADRQAFTGRKSACKQCEQDAAARKAAAR